MSKKILLLTAGYGTGHISASRSIGEEIHKIKPQDVEVKTYDFINTKGFINAGRTFQKLYNWSMEKPWVWDTFFDWTNSRAATYYFKTLFPLFYRKVHAIFDSENPDLCIVTHPYWNFLINDHNRENGKRVRYFCVVTDAIEIHQTWIDPDADMYFVCDDATGGIIESKGVKKEKIVVSGFPVSTLLGEPLDRKKFLNEFGLADMPTLLFVLGLGNVERFLEIIDNISKHKELNFQVIVITGKYKELQNVLQQKKIRRPHKDSRLDRQDGGFFKGVRPGGFKGRRGDSNGNACRRQADYDSRIYPGSGKRKRKTY